MERDFPIKVIIYHKMANKQIIKSYHQNDDYKNRIVKLWLVVQVLYLLKLNCRSIIKT